MLSLVKDALCDNEGIYLFLENTSPRGWLKRVQRFLFWEKTRKFPFLWEKTRISFFWAKALFSGPHRIEPFAELHHDALQAAVGGHDGQQLAQQLALREA
jgi:hypothetical protein